MHNVHVHTERSVHLRALYIHSTRPLSQDSIVCELSSGSACVPSDAGNRSRDLVSGSAWPMRISSATYLSCDRLGYGTYLQIRATG
jgi:hypothetical protein